MKSTNTTIKAKGASRGSRQRRSRTALFLASCSILLAAGSQAARADTLADWTFETSKPVTAGPFAAESGVYATTSAASGYHAGTSTYSSPAGNGSSHSFSSNTWAINDYYQFKLSTTSYSSIQLTFDQTSSSTGPANFQLAYSTDGTTFTNVSSGAYTVTNTNWSSSSAVSGTTYAFNLSTTTALNGQSAVYFRLTDTSTTAAGGGTVGASGSDRVDNVIVSGNFVSTPSYFDLNGSQAGSGVANGGSYTFSGSHFNAAADGTGATAAFVNGNTAVFSAGADGGTATYTVNIDQAVTTGGLTVNSGNVTLAHASGGSLTLAGNSVSVASGATATISEAVAGTAGLTKDGSGLLTLTNTSNSFSGTVTLDAGTLSIGSDANLGTSTNGLSFAGGTLTTTASITSARNLSVGASGGTFDTGGFDSSTSGTSAINGVLTKNSAGNLALNGAVTFGSAAGSLVINAGAVTLGQTSGTITMSNGGTFNGNLIVASGGPRINFSGSTAYAGTGQIQVQGSGLLISNLSGTQAGTINTSISLNSTGISFTKGDVTASTYAPGSFVTTIGGTKNQNPGDTTLTVGGVISGASDVNFANDSTKGGGSGNTLLNAQNTYTGTTTINSNGANVILGVTNALPTTTDLIFGTQTGIGSPQLDLNGHDQTISSLSSGANGSGYGVTNKGATASTLTVGGSTTPANAFSGVLSNGTSTLALTKSGTGTLTLSGISTYTGNTNVNAGTLVVSGSLNGNGVTVNVNNGGTLTLSNATALNDYSTLNLNGGSTLNLNAPSSQGNPATETIGLLNLDGTAYGPGTYTAAALMMDDPGLFVNSPNMETLTVTGVPEPATVLGGILVVGALGWSQRRRLRTFVLPRPQIFPA